MGSLVSALSPTAVLSYGESLVLYQPLHESVLQAEGFRLFALFWKMNGR